MNKAWNYPHIISPFYRLYYVEDGEGWLVNPEQTIHMQTGNFYLIPSYTLCSYRCDSRLDLYYIHFTEESSDGSSLFYNNRKLFAVPAAEADIGLMKTVLRLNSGRVLSVSTDPRVYERRPVLREDVAQSFTEPLPVQMTTQGILLQLLSRFVQAPEYNNQNSGILPSKIQDTVNYIQAHLREPLTVSGLAARVHLHPDYFSRLFQENMGERPLEYIQQKKIEYAQFLITTTQFPLNEIAFNSGFESISYFSRMFKRVTGFSPSQYRRNSSGLWL